MFLIRQFILIVLAAWLAIYPNWLIAQMQYCHAALGPGTTLFQSSSPINFPSDFSNRSCGTSDVDCAVNSTNQHNGVNTLQIHYVCSTPPCDVNRWVDKSFTEQSGAIYVQGYINIHINAGGSSQNANVQRKLIWIDDGDGGTFDWSFILDTWYNVADSTIRISASDNATGGCTSIQDFNLATLNFDTWYKLELYFKPDTGNLSNGQYKIWVDGVEKSGGSHANSACVRGTNTVGIKSVSFGRQTDTSTTNVDEYKYWDGLKASTAFIP